VSFDIENDICPAATFNRNGAGCCAKEKGIPGFSPGGFYMRIGIDGRFLQGPRRGIGQYVYYLIKELLGLDDENEYVIFYNSLKTGEFVFDKTTPRLKQIWCNIPGTLLRHTWPRFRFPPVEYFIGNVDIFHNPANFCFTHYAPIPSHAKMVATFNGMADPATIWESYDPKKINNWFWNTAREAKIIIMISEMAKEDFLRRVHVPEERIRVIYYGVNEEFRLLEDRKAVEAVLSKHGLAGKRYLLYVGGAEPNKNLSALISTFCQISKRADFEDVYLAFAGNIDNFYRGLIGEAARLGIERKIVSIGYVGHDKLPFIYNGAEAFVLPTLNEWFGIPVLEAMACGLPVITSKNTGAIEAVGDSVITFDPENKKEMADSISAVLRDKGLRLSLRDKGRERVKKLSWKETARKTLAVYEEVYNKD